MKLCWQFWKLSDICIHAEYDKGQKVDCWCRNNKIFVKVIEETKKLHHEYSSLGNLIQVAVVWTVVVALLTKCSDLIYTDLLLIQMFLQTKIINLLIVIIYVYTEWGMIVQSGKWWVWIRWLEFYSHSVQWYLSSLTMFTVIYSWSMD
jgi:hypothetical protein